MGQQFNVVLRLTVVLGPAIGPDPGVEVWEKQVLLPFAPSGGQAIEVVERNSKKASSDLVRSSMHGVVKYIIESDVFVFETTATGTSYTDLEALGFRRSRS